MFIWTIVAVIVVIIVLAFLVRYFRTSTIFIETADMNSDFIEGVEEACDALNVRLIRDHRDPDCASATIITTQSIECGDKLITYGPTAKGGTFHVDVNQDNLLQKAIEVAYQKKAGRIAVVGFEDDDATIGETAFINIATTKERVLEDVFRIIQNRVIDAFVIMDPSLMFDRRKIVNSKLIIACGFESDRDADINVYYDSKEQGYMAAVLAYNLSKGRKFFRDVNVQTKIYVTDNKQ